MGNSKMGVTAKNFARAPRAVSFMLTYSEMSAGALVVHPLYSVLWTNQITVFVGCPTENVEVCKTNSSRWFRVDPP